DFYFLSRWHWYEWLGVFAPLLLLLVFRRVAARDRSPETQVTNSVLLPFLSALIYYGVFQTILGIALMLPNSLSRVRPLEPMRYLHLLYLLFLLIAGGLLGRYVLDKRLYRWMSIFIVLAAGMFYTQRELYPASTHLELPFIAPQNRWLQAFAWISRDTPVDALFAIDPHYMTLPAEDYHGFRALAERSVLADYEKDAGMAARVPGLAPRWFKEVTALNGWRTFQSADFARLKKEFGVSWILLSPADAMYASPDQNIMTCPYDHQQIKVCRLY
ncbi:MAG TPA: hypothetical protein VMD76_08645, partial [Candidatus Sulfotelmatobacter sp.]|nr:hypothetical protein [Candidatus Sulfotelmatobacter sp.]